jgi:hypothetical protein
VTRRTVSTKQEYCCLPATHTFYNYCKRFSFLPTCAACWKNYFPLLLSHKCVFYFLCPNIIVISVAEKVKNFAVVYVCDIDEVPDFNDMYELYDECSTMFFFRNKHIMVDMGTGDNNKINWALTGR